MQMNHKKIILILSSVIPLLVFALYMLPKFSFVTVDFLPLFNASINGTVFVLLVLALIAIKKGKKNLHQRLIYLAISLSALFLVSYVYHHATHDSVKYLGEGFIRYVYYFVLLSHILLAIIIIPLVLVTLSRALQQKYTLHRKIARITMPIWLYVSLTGVIVYLMISPYYPY